QDTDEIQIRVIRAITERYGNCLFVGDVNQCQPLDTLITCHGDERKKLGDLTDDARVLAWTQREQRVYTRAARRIRIEQRWYSGPMLTVKTGTLSTRMTPGHQMLVRFTKKARCARIVYLM